MITVQMDRNLTIVSLLLQVSIARRGGGAVAGSGKGNKTTVKGRGRSASKHIGKGLEAIDLQTDLPCNSLLEPVVSSEAVIGTTHKDLCLSKAADRAASLRMVGDTDKFAVPEDDATTSPVPERVWLLFSRCVPLHGVQFCRAIDQVLSFDLLQSLSCAVFSCFVLFGSSIM